MKHLLYISCTYPAASVGSSQLWQHNFEHNRYMKELSIIGKHSSILVKNDWSTLKFNFLVYKLLFYKLHCASSINFYNHLPCVCHTANKSSVNSYSKNYKLVALLHSIIGKNKHNRLVPKHQKIYISCTFAWQEYMTFPAYFSLISEISYVMQISNVKDMWHLLYISLIHNSNLQWNILMLHFKKGYTYTILQTLCFPY